jgi:hypothetical protein
VTKISADEILKIKQARFLEWRPYINGTSVMPNVSKRLTVGELTSSSLFEHLIDQRKKQSHPPCELELLRVL